ncbi:MAG TPA: hypothetical protein VLH60_00285 [Sedimentisphaerales bacterium]|nr:hypothetical protein [Sedimentisphaerales bacterium]
MMRKNRRGETAGKEERAAADLCADPKRRRSFDIAAVVILLALGGWLSFNYFGHKQVPNSDFPAFVSISRQLLSGSAPANYKRVPVHGAMVAGISLFTQSSDHPDLTAGWILNAVIYPFVGVFTFLIAKRFIAPLPAAMLAVIAAVNPWTLYMLRDPICEINLLVFFLASFYLMAIRSRWCYLAASVGSMVRYEAAGIIVCALLVDFLSTKDRKEWLKSFVCAAAAMIPLIIWLTATFMRGLKPGETHYLSELGEFSGRQSTLQIFTKDLPIQIRLLWQVAYHPLLLPPAFIRSFFVRPTPAEVQAITNTFSMLQFAAAFTFVCGTVHAIVKRNWHMLAMVLFLVMYLLVHAVHSFAFHRFLTAVYWIALLVSFFGLQGLWRLIHAGGRLPSGVVRALQIFVVCAAGVWLARLLWPIEYDVGRSVWPMTVMEEVSVRSAAVLYAAIAAAVLSWAAFVLLFRAKHLRYAAVLTVVVAAMLFSNQYSIATTLRNGKTDDEFRQTVEWYRQNASPGEKIACSMFMIMAMIDEKNAPYFVPLPVTESGPGDPQRFLEMCYARNISYVVWDSRLGFAEHDRYYWMKGLNNIRALSEPRSIGPYEFLVRLESPYTGRYVHIFRLHRPPGSQQPPGPQ